MASTAFKILKQNEMCHKIFTYLQSVSLWLQSWSKIWGGGESESSLTVSGYDYVGAVKDCFFFVCTCHCLAFTYDIKAVLINKRQIKSC